MRPHEVVGRVVRGHRFSRVSPEPFKDVVLHDATFQVPVVDIGDLQLPTTRWLELGEYRPDRLVVEVHAGHGIIARRVFRLFDDSLDPAASVELSYAQMP